MHEQPHTGDTGLGVSIACIKELSTDGHEAYFRTLSVHAQQA